jgi:hypothetical protein
VVQVAKTGVMLSKSRLVQVDQPLMFESATMRAGACPSPATKFHLRW